MEEKITSFMIQEHGKILALLSEFKKKRNTSGSASAFDNLDKNLGRHVLAEEKAIIMLQSRGEEFKEMAIILEQHDEIEEYMKNIRPTLKISDNDLTGLLELMKRHIRLENEKFYPKLDRDLTEEERKKVFEKLHEAIIGNIKI